MIERLKNMKVITISNFKGGVGKTTTAVNLATLYANAGQKVLLIDLDPQASATDYFQLYEKAENENKTTKQLLFDGAAIKDIAFATDVENLDLVAANMQMADENEVNLAEDTLKFAIEDESENYDVVILDCSPTIKTIANLAYTAASQGGMVLVPVKLDSTVMRGTNVTINGIKAICNKKRIPTPEIKIVRTCVPGAMTNAEKYGAEILENFFGDLILDTTIHASSKVGEGSYSWKPIVTFKGKNRTAQDYKKLAEELTNECK